MSRRDHLPSSPLAVALDVLDQGWALLVVQELLHQARSLDALVEALPVLDPARVGATVQALCETGLVRVIPGASGGGPYTLTDAARGLAPVVDALAAWGALVTPDEAGGGPIEG